MKVLLCCIARLENRYIREFVEHYKNLGVDNICLYDNNFDGEEDFNDVLSDYINSGYVILKDFRNKKYAQFAAYNDCYSTYKKEYDWIMFFDIDEFLDLAKHGDIKEFLRQDKFNEYNAVHIKWIIFDDNDIIYDDGGSVVNRFTRVAKGTDSKYMEKENSHVKTILRGNLDCLVFDNPHAAKGHHTYKACDVEGTPRGFTSFFSNCQSTEAVLHHYTTKTVDEYITKIKRGSATRPRDYQMYIDKFFGVNIPTKEKIDIILDSTGVDMSHLIKP
jgi:hypothetical protein